MLHRHGLLIPDEMHKMPGFCAINEFPYLLAMILTVAI